MRTSDVIVLGLGSMGASAARELAGRGQRVIGLERFGPAHDRGSAHGGSRIVRQSYFEGEAYVPLLRRAYDGWRTLEEQSGSELLTLCGGIYIGDPDSVVFAGARSAAEQHHLAHEVLDADSIRARFPTLDPADHALGLYEAAAGFVRPEAAVLANLSLARRSGAELRFGEGVRSWTSTPGGGVEVTTGADRYGADRLVISAGAWAPELLAAYEFPIRVERQVMYWFEPEISPELPYERWASPEHPVYIEETDGNREFYGFPMTDGPDGGIKCAFFNTGVQTTPDGIDRVVHAGEVEEVRARARQLLPRVTGPLLAARTCLYATTPDAAFVIGLLPDRPQVAIACGFSGHGFKFVPVVGEILADLVTSGRTAHAIGLFDLQRPALQRA